TVLDIPKYGCINVHGSLLPKYRGAAPIQWAVLNGETITGVTTMYMGEGIDIGDILLTSATDIAPEETSGELFDRLKFMGAKLLLETIDKLETLQIVPKKQDDKLVTYAPMISKEMSEIDWTKSATLLQNQIRGLNPWPCASCKYMGKRLKIFSAQHIALQGLPGTVFCRNGSFCVYCGEDALELLEVQSENGKRMPGKNFLLGHPLHENPHFDS
ncbi:MAG: methionyl-tRNA formyltransferase, partial [Oscillospiraceae bacterium]